MNIFYVDEDPNKAAMSLVDKHVVKMILESAQLLSTAHRVIDGVLVDGKYELVIGGSVNFDTAHVKLAPDPRNDRIYKATHINHPCAIWVRESVENYNWLVDHLIGLLTEYTWRYGKKHKTEEILWDINTPPNKLKEWDATPIRCAMPAEYIISTDPVVNYRNYYNHAKRDLFHWTKRDRPEWILDEHELVTRPPLNAPDV